MNEYILKTRQKRFKKEITEKEFLDAERKEKQLEQLEHEDKKSN